MRIRDAEFHGEGSNHISHKQSRSRRLHIARAASHFAYTLGNVAPSSHTA